MTGFVPGDPSEQVAITASGFVLQADEFDGRGLRLLLSHAHEGDSVDISRSRPVGRYRLSRIEAETRVAHVGDGVITLLPSVPGLPDDDGGREESAWALVDPSDDDGERNESAWAIVDPAALSEADAGALGRFCAARAVATVTALCGPLFVPHPMTGTELADYLALPREEVAPGA